MSLYQKICDLRFDENLWWKDVAKRLNDEGWTSTKGKKNTASTVCSTYFKIRKHFERKHKYLPPDLDDVERLGIVFQLMVHLDHKLIDKIL